MNDITKRPKAETKHADEIRPPARKEVLTFRRLLTEDDAHTYRIDFLKMMSTHKGPWAEYWEFFRANHSGDMSGMSKEIRAKCEKIITDIKAKYSEEMQ